MQPSVFGLLWALGQKAAVAFLLVYILFRLGLFRRVTEGRFDLRDRLIMAIFFGGLSILGTYNGVRLPSGAIANVTEMAPMVAGLIGGPLVGTAAGLIGGVHRYFLGGLTALPCAISTILAGLAGGLIYNWRGRRTVPGPGAATFALLMEAVAMSLILLISRPFSAAWGVVQVIALPMIIGNAIGVGLTVSMVNTLSKDRGD